MMRTLADKLKDGVTEDTSGQCDGYNDGKRMDEAKQQLGLKLRMVNLLLGLGGAFLFVWIALFAFIYMGNGLPAAELTLNVIGILVLAGAETGLVVCRRALKKILGSR